MPGIFIFAMAICTRWVLYLHDMEEEREDQGGNVTCPKSLCWEKPGFECELRYKASKALTLCYGLTLMWSVSQHIFIEHLLCAGHSRTQQ